MGYIGGIKYAERIHQSREKSFFLQVLPKGFYFRHFVTRENRKKFVKKRGCDNVYAPSLPFQNKREEAASAALDK